MKAMEMTEKGVRGEVVVKHIYFVLQGGMEMRCGNDKMAYSLKSQQNSD